MSLRSLNKRIQHCSQEMDKQRRCTQRLLDQQKDDIRHQVQKIPLPVAMGGAAIGGFLAERLSHSLIPRRLIRLFLT